MPQEGKLSDSSGHSKLDRIGTSTFIWHDGRARYDEVVWDPKPSSAEEAERIASEMLAHDGRVTRVMIQVGESTVAEAAR